MSEFSQFKSTPSSSPIDVKDAVARQQLQSTQTASGNPLTLTDCAPINAEKLEVELEPKQDLHGQSAPYVGGAGKNKLPMTVDGIKAANTDGTWNGNVYTINNGTFTILTDSDGNVTGIKANTNGAASAWCILYLRNLSLPSGSYLLSNTFASGSIYVEYYGYGATNGSAEVPFTTNGATGNVYIAIREGETVTNRVMRPMIRLATETDPTFAPYSNICPITGYTECEVENVGKNLFDDNGEVSVYDIDTGGTQRAGYKKTLLAGTYTISAQNGASGSYLDAVLYKDGEFTSIGRIVDTTILQTFTFTIDTAKELRIFDAASAQTSIAEQRIKAAQFQVEIGSTATAYEPYHSSNATIQFGQTVYGGKSNFIDGGTDDEIGVVDLGSLNWSYDATQSHPFFYTTDLSSIIKHIIGFPQPLVACEQYRILDIPTNVTDSAWADASVHASMIYHASSPNYVYVRDDRFTDPTDFKNANSGNHLAYMKATPTQLSTPPTDLKLLKGTNNITTNGNTITLGYQPDNVIGEVKGEIEKHLEMPWVKVIDDDTTIDFDDIPIEGPVEYAYVLADNEFFKHRFILLEVYEMAGGLIRSFIRASSLLSIDTLLEFSGSAYGEMVSFPKSGDTVEVFVGIVDDDGTYKFTISLESTGSTIYNDFRARARYID